MFQLYNCMNQLYIPAKSLQSCPIFRDVTLWTIVHQASLSMRFSRQEYWSWLPCPPLGDLPDPRIEPVFLMSPASAGRFFTTSATWEAPESALCIQVSPASWASLPTPSPFHPSRSSQSTKLSFLCHTTAFHWLLFYTWQYIYYIYTHYSLNLSHNPLHPLWLDMQSAKSLVAACRI